jgi:probable HAF family extracellular repeat protein
MWHFARLFDLASRSSSPPSGRARYRKSRRRTTARLESPERLEIRSCPSTYAVTQLPLVPGDAQGQAKGLNNAATVQVVGFSGGHAVLWQKNAGGTFVVQDLGNLGGVAAESFGINDSGRVVGTSYTLDNGSGNTIQHAFLWTPGGTDGVPSNPQMKDLDTLGSTQSAALAVSSAGKAVGYFQSQNENHAFVWENNEMYDLNTLLPPNSGWLLLQAVGINATQIVGQGQLNGQFHHFQITDSDGVFSDGFTITDLGPENGANTRGGGMSSDGSQITGMNAAGHAVLWHGGSATDLGTLSGGYGSWGNSVNTSAQVVGTAIDKYYAWRPFLWQNGQMTDVNRLVPHGSTVSSVNAINNAGDIAGYTYVNGDLPILLTPTTKSAARSMTAASTATPAIASEATTLGTTPAVTDDTGSIPQGPLGLMPDLASWTTTTSLAAHRRHAR